MRTLRRSEVRSPWPSPPGGWTPRRHSIIRRWLTSIPLPITIPYISWKPSDTPFPLSMQDVTRMTSHIHANVLEKREFFRSRLVSDYGTLPEWIAGRCRKVPEAQQCQVGHDEVRVFFPDMEDYPEVLWTSPLSIKRALHQIAEQHPAWEEWVLGCLHAWQDPDQYDVCEATREPSSPWGWLDHLHYDQWVITQSYSPDRVRLDLMHRMVLDPQRNHPYFGKLSTEDRIRYLKTRRAPRISVVDRQGDWWLLRELLYPAFIFRGRHRTLLTNDYLVANWVIWSPGWRQQSPSGTVWLASSLATSVQDAIASLTTPATASRILQGAWVWAFEDVWLIETHQSALQIDPWLDQWMPVGESALEQAMRVHWMPGSPTLTWDEVDATYRVPIAPTVQGLQAVRLKPLRRQLISWGMLKRKGVLV